MTTPRFLPPDLGNRMEPRPKPRGCRHLVRRLIAGSWYVCSSCGAFKAVRQGYKWTRLA